MSDQIKCAILICMNNDGDWVVVREDEDSVEKMADEYGGHTMRVAKIIVSMTPPVASEVEVTIPDDAGETVHAEAEEAA